MVEIFRATIGVKFSPLFVAGNNDTEVDKMVNTLNTAVTEIANDINGKHRPTKMRWVTEKHAKAMRQTQRIETEKNEPGCDKLYKEVNLQIKKGMVVAKKTWI